MIDTNSIRNNVLELATSGKLTNSSPMDGCIDALYAWIVSEKEKIIETGVLKGRKNKEVKEVIDDEMFELPRNWMWIRLGEVVEVFGRIGFRGYTKADIVEADAGAITISPSNIDEKGNMSFDNCTYISWKKYEESPEIQISNDDIIIVKTGSSYGKAGIVKNLPKKATINPQLAVLKYILCNKEYLNIVLNSPMAKKQYEQFVIGAAIPTFSQEKLSNLLMPLPSIEEQGRIVDRVTKVYEILDKIDHLQESYFVDIETLQSKLIDAGIQGKLTEQLLEDGTAEELYLGMVEEKKQILKDRNGREDKNIKEVDDDVPYELPANWKWVRFGEIGLFKKGPFGSALTKAMFVPKSEETVKVYEQQHAIQKKHELGTYYITREYFDDKMSGFEVLPGDILVSCAGTIGETYILPDEIEQGIINQALMRVSLVPSINKRFFQYYFDANLKKAAQEESNGSAIKNIPPFDVMKNWYFPLAPLKEQERIVEKIEELLSLI